tara:strand:- start:16484 stop:16822 length:339 start_codon:yes stop_codon:yes gene_type:complete
MQDYIYQIVVRIPLWFVCSLLFVPPIIYCFAILKKHSQSRLLNTVALSLLTALLIAPVPASMWIMFMPIGFALMDGLQGYAWGMSKFWISPLITAALVSYCYWRWFEVEDPD